MNPLMHPLLTCKVKTHYDPRTKKQADCGAPVGRYRATATETVTGYVVTRSLLIHRDHPTPMCLEHAARAGQVGQPWTH